MYKSRQRRMARSGGRKHGLRSARLQPQMPAPPQLPPHPAAMDAGIPVDAPQRLLGEVRIQGMLVMTFCAAFSLIGLMMMMQGGERIREARQVEDWRMVSGVIESSDVLPVPGSEGAQWRPRVTYSYAVGGRMVVSSRLSLGKTRFDDTRERAFAYLERYPLGRTVTVYYDPDEITQSVLETATPASAYFNLLSGCALALIGPGLLVLFRRSAHVHAYPAPHPAPSKG